MRVIRKIVSSGQTGVELAALDIAIKLGIAHGGWVSRGKRNEDGALPAQYDLTETASLGFKEAMDKNVSHTDGTLVISRNMHTSRTKNAVQAALKHQRQFLHLDLGQYSLFESASLAASWMSQQLIKAVFITGPMASEDERIYSQTQKVLETLFYLGFVKSGLHPDRSGIQATPPSQSLAALPGTVAEAVDRLQGNLSLKDRTLLANLQSHELNHLHSGISEYIKQNFGLYAGNPQLLDDCARVGGLTQPLVDEACAVILRALWQTLRKTHKLRVIK
jgi:hypothetical protein